MFGFVPHAAQSRREAIADHDDVREAICEGPGHDGTDEADQGALPNTARRRILRMVYLRAMEVNEMI
jgi:hypothetical protein